MSTAKDLGDLAGNTACMFGLLLQKLVERGTLTPDDCRAIVNAVSQGEDDPTPREDLFLTGILRIALAPPDRKPSRPASPDE